MPLSLAQLIALQQQIGAAPDTDSIGASLQGPSQLAQMMSQQGMPDQTQSIQPQIDQQQLMAQNGPSLDDKMRLLEQMRNENTMPNAPASGDFFQRLLRNGGGNTIPLSVFGGTG